MSANRRTTGDQPGLDCPVEITFEEFLDRCKLDPICRVQGHNPPETKAERRLVRFNRSVRVLTDTAELGRWPKVSMERVQWNKIIGEYVPIGETMVVFWRDLDWVTPQASNDPNGTWVKVKEVR